MKGLKTSIMLIVFTIITCLIMVIASGAGVLQGFKKIENDDIYAASNIIVDEGTFPGDVNYVFAEGRDIYHTKWNIRESIDAYNILSQRSDTLLKPVNAGYKIDLFCKTAGYYIWKESSGSVNEQDDDGQLDWKMYVRENNNIIKIDEKSQDAENSKVSSEIHNGRFSAYGSYLVYKTYDTIPGTNEKGTVLKLYDLLNKDQKAIFSLSDVKGTLVSDPYIYKNTVVWSVCKAKYSSSESSEGDIYMYDISSGSYRRLTERAPFIEPIVWENTVICKKQEGYKTGITLIDVSNGQMKDIAAADNMKSPGNDFHDYSAGGGYVTWNTGNADSVCVYDILNDKTYKLKESLKDNTSDNSLISIYIYDKILLYTDHVFSTKSGRTISETNRFVILK